MEAKLHEITADFDFQLKVYKTLANMETHSEAPKIYETKRTVEQQREKVRKGYSKTMRSDHLKRGSDGGSWACDVADRAKGWNARKRFWFLLGANAQSRGMGWGGLFGLSRKQKANLIAAFDRLRKKGWPQADADYEVPVGWDVAHLSAKSNW